MDKAQFDMALRVGGIFVLIIVILFILTWSGIVKCRDLTPYFCDAYDFVLGSPRVLIVHGDSGLGEPEVLREYLRNPLGVAVQNVDVQHVDRITLGNLKSYKLVIVEQARKLSMDQLVMFMDYVNKYGGRLVWVGDSGVEFGDGETRDVLDGNVAKKILDNPWVRVKETDTEYKIISFDEFLGIRYINNYCAEKECTETPFSVGTLETELTGDHPLIFGFAPVINFKVKKDRDFAVVKQIPDSYASNIIMTINFGGNIKGTSGYLGKSAPMIVTSSTGMGERIAYYAYPPEWFLSDNNYTSGILLKNMFNGMLGR
jgi:hypothetical protein